ncbi:DUF4249 family protein [Aquimarina muelleri]|uniref:DUF4249 family protein n=1 Tax=Aquimarina muelleri TaxID=279356 RepID=UPI003F6821E3
MKKIIYLLAIFFIFLNCEDVIEVDTPIGTSRLVIDASFELYLNETPITMEGGVKLTLSAPFFDKETPIVSNATVFITNLTDNSIINFTESGKTGYYTSNSIRFIPEFNTTYQLSVIYDNETYLATAQLIPTVPIDNVEQGDNTLLEGNETEVVIYFTDKRNRDDFYLFDFDFSLFLASEDRFYQGKTFNFSYFYKDMVNNRDVTIKILGIDKRYYNYSNLLIEQSEQGGGNPFQTPPAVPRGNIINTSNPSKYALGYFNLSEANRFEFTIKK